MDDDKNQINIEGDINAGNANIGGVQNFYGTVNIGSPAGDTPPKRKMRIFISYARADDEPFVERLYHDLKDEFEVWWDRVSMPNRGLTFLQEIRDAIDHADRLLLVAGPLAFTSDYVRDEWLYAYETYKGINIALRLGDYPDLPEQLSGFDAPDFRSDEDYDERLATLKRQLAEPVAPVGQFHNVPALPPHFLNRPDALDALRDLVIADVDKPTLISAEKRTTAVEGMGGIGKSVMATAFAHDRKVRFAFPDGIVWLTAGHKPSMYELYRGVGVALGDDLSNYPDETTARQNAQKALADKKCLLILDDVWELPVGRAFRNLISGTSARLLITTRNLQINNVLNANEYRLELIDKSRAGDYLRSWVGDDPELETIAEKLGYLFLALKLAGARMKKDGLSGADYLRTFDRVSRMKIDRQASDREDSLEVSITLSLDAAFEGIKDRQLLYFTLGIFPEDTPISKKFIMLYWRGLRPDIAEHDLSETLIASVDVALVDHNTNNNTLALHDILHNFAREQLSGRFIQANEAILNSYQIPDSIKLIRPSNKTDLHVHSWRELFFRIIFDQDGSNDDIREDLEDIIYDDEIQEFLFSVFRLCIDNSNSNSLDFIITTIWQFEFWHFIEDILEEISKNENIAFDVCEDFLDADNPYAKRKAIQLLGEMRDDRITSRLVDLLGDTSFADDFIPEAAQMEEEICDAAAYALRQIGSERALSAINGWEERQKRLNKLRNSGDNNVIVNHIKFETVKDFHEHNIESAKAILSPGSSTNLVADVNFYVRRTITECLLIFSEPSMLPLIVKVLESDDYPDVRHDTAKSIALLRRENAVSVLIQTLSDRGRSEVYIPKFMRSENDMYEVVANALQRIGTKRSLIALRHWYRTQ